MLLADGARCAFSPVLTWTDPGALAAQFARRVVDLLEEWDARGSLMTSDEVARTHGDLLHEAAARGHEVDLALDSHLALGEMGPQDLQAALDQAVEAFEAVGLECFVGLRPGVMQRIGIQKHEEVQAVLQARGVAFVSSDYSTKLPDNPSSPGFADKNAAMLIKHSQPRRYPGGLLEIPAAGYSARDFLEVQQRPVDAWGDHLKACIDFAFDLGGLMVAPCLDLQVLADRDPGCAGLAAALAHARAKRTGKVLIRGLRVVLESSDS